MEILQSKIVLLADDDNNNVYALLAALEDIGLEIVTATNGIEALRKLEEAERIDIVLMDIMMPEMDGFEAMKIIRSNKKYADLPVIALTAKAMKGDIEKCLEAGATGYLSKPIDVDKLLELMRDLLNKRKH